MRADWNAADENLLVTGGADGSTSVFDKRKVRDCLYSSLIVLLFPCEMCKCKSTLRVCDFSWWVKRITHEITPTDDCEAACEYLHPLTVILRQVGSERGTAAPLHALNEHQDAVYRVCWLPKSCKHFASGGEDSLVVVWDITRWVRDIKYRSHSPSGCLQ